LAHLLLTSFGRKKLMHIISLNAGRQIDRAGVAERAVFATRIIEFADCPKQEIPI
jgi:hypothetical protein